MPCKLQLFENLCAEEADGMLILAFVLTGDRQKSREIVEKILLDAFFGVMQWGLEKPSHLELFQRVRDACNAIPACMKSDPFAPLRCRT